MYSNIEVYVNYKCLIHLRLVSKTVILAKYKFHIFFKMILLMFVECTINVSKRVVYYTYLIYKITIGFKDIRFRE